MPQEMFEPFTRPVTTAVFADRLGRSLDWVQRGIREGRIPKVPIHGQHLIPYEYANSVLIFKYQNQENEHRKAA